MTSGMVFQRPWSRTASQTWREWTACHTRAPSTYTERAPAASARRPRSASSPPPSKRSSKPPEPLEQLARVGHVARLVPAARADDRLASGEAVQAPDLVRVRLGAPLEQEAPLLALGGLDEALEPVRRGPAVVVGERDQPSAGGGDALVAQGARARPGALDDLRPELLGRADRLVRLAPAHHDDLVAVAGKRLLLQGLEQERKARLPTHRGHDDRDIRRCRSPVRAPVSGGGRRRRLRRPSRRRPRAPAPAGRRARAPSRGACARIRADGGPDTARRPRRRAAGGASAGPPASARSSAQCARRPNSPAASARRCCGCRSSTSGTLRHRRVSRSAFPRCRECTAWRTTASATKCCSAPAADGAQAQVGVLAADRIVAGVGAAEALVEATEPFEQLARVGDVARLVPPARRGDLLRHGQPVQAPDLVGVGLGSALEQEVAIAPVRRGEQLLEPVGRGPAVVVGERDQAAPWSPASRRCASPPARSSPRPTGT